MTGARLLPQAQEQRRGKGTRLVYGCVYCPELATTWDHVPPKVFLDRPLPPNPPKVRACSPCNSRTSKDEEWLACFIDSVVAGTARPNGGHRSRIERSLEHSSLLSARIEKRGREDIDGCTLVWQPEKKRVENVMVKLARGHVAYLLGHAPQQVPNDIRYSPIIVMDREAMGEFESPASQGMWPDSLSALKRAAHEFTMDSRLNRWLVVQEGRYRYRVSLRPRVRVWMVLCDYLAAEVSW